MAVVDVSRESRQPVVLDFFALPASHSLVAAGRFPVGQGLDTLFITNHPMYFPFNPAIDNGWNDKVP